MTKNASEAVSDLDREAAPKIEAELRGLLADALTLYIKTKSFHWHMRGRHFCDYHLLLDEHAGQIFGITDDLAERTRKLGGTNLRSIEDISRQRRLNDWDRVDLCAEEMLRELQSDNRQFTRLLRIAHAGCERRNDVASTSLIEVRTDQSERRTWFLAEIVTETP